MQGKTLDQIVDVGAEEDVPRFDAGMRPNEVMELILDSLGRTGAVNVAGTGLRPDIWLDFQRRFGIPKINSSSFPSNWVWTKRSVRLTRNTARRR